MDRDEILSLVGDLESDRVERKESLANADRVCEAICAFANDMPSHRKPGVLVIGVRDDGTPANIPINDSLLLKLANFRDNGQIYPFPSMTVDRLSWKGAEIAIALVEPSATPPVQFKGRTWIRVGPRRAIATPEEEARLSERRRIGAAPFDARPVAGATMDDLLIDHFKNELLPQLAAPDVLAANGRSVEHQLAALRFADAGGTPTPTGVLFTGLDPGAWIPGAFIQFLRIDGTTLDGPISSAHRITSLLPQAITELEEVMRAHIETGVRFAGSPTEERRANVPFEAMQQIVRNAVMHRSYEATNAPVRVTWFDDRVEVQSPGGPYGNVHAENFGLPGVTDYRNPTIAGVLGQLGYVQQFGVGIETARAVLMRNGNPPLEFDVSPTFVNMRVRIVR